MFIWDECFVEEINSWSCWVVLFPASTLLLLSFPDHYKTLNTLATFTWENYSSKCRQPVKRSGNLLFRLSGRRQAIYMQPVSGGS